ncbi:MAG: SPFH domain-containing protein [Rhodothermales bacterium]
MDQHDEVHDQMILAEQSPRRRRKKSGGGFSFGMALLGLLLILLPYFIAQLAGVQFVMIIFGTGILILSAIMLTITRLYIKAAPNEAFARTGMGGQKVIVDGGTLVIPVMHELVFVSLETMRLDVSRRGPDALITGDNLRADLNAEFYIHVTKSHEGVAAAAKSLGDRSLSPAYIKKLVFEKLVSALRTVAATRTLQELHAERADFAKEVQAIVSADLEANGLTLESVTISLLDQTAVDALRAAENVFDAQGALTIARVIQKNRVDTNRIEREADKEVEAQNVDKQKYVFEQQVAEAEASAEKEANIEKANAKAKQEADTYRAEQERIAELAEVAKTEAVAVREQERQQAEEVANRTREKAEQVASIERDEAAALAERAKEIRIAEQERARAEAEAERARAEKEREEALQATLTVEVVQTAEREKAKAVIAEQAEIEKTRLKDQMIADVEAYTLEKTAEGRLQAAEADAKAALVEADAAKQAKTLNADGDRAVQMVPVEVAARQVEVDDAMVTVKRRDLEAQAQFESIARELQVELAKIEAERDAQIAAAEAFGNALGQANMQIWGDPTTLARMSGAFLKGQQNGEFVRGLGTSLPDEFLSFAERTAGGIGDLAAAVVKKFTGTEVPPDKAKKMLLEYLASSSDTAAASGPDTEAE